MLNCCQCNWRLKKALIILKGTGISPFYCHCVRLNDVTNCCDFTIARYTLASVFSCKVPYIWQLIPRDDRLRVGIVTGVEIKWLLDSLHSF